MKVIEDGPIDSTGSDARLAERDILLCFRKVSSVVPLVDSFHESGKTHLLIERPKGRTLKKHLRNM